MSFEYDPIKDWSVEGRARLVEERGSELRLLLDEAFTRFLDDTTVGLSRFGFRADDPVLEAVEWSIERFAKGDIDPRRVSHADRSLRLFTRPKFWLAQRVGTPAYRRLMHETVEQVQTSTTDLNSALDEHKRRLAETLKQLRRRTCAQLVGYWLLGTERQRADWFGWDEPVPPLQDRTPKQRSFHVADALFRFGVLFSDLLPDDPALALRVCLVTLFAPCEDAPPFRNDDRHAATTLGLGGPHRAAAARRSGVRTLARQLLEIANQERRFDAELARLSLRRSLLHHYKIDDADLAQAIRALRTGGS